MIFIIVWWTHYGAVPPFSTCSNKILEIGRCFTWLKPTCNEPLEGKRGALRLPRQQTVFFIKLNTFETAWNAWVSCRTTWGYISYHKEKPQLADDEVSTPSLSLSHNQPLQLGYIWPWTAQTTLCWRHLRQVLHSLDRLAPPVFLVPISPGIETS